MDFLSSGARFANLSLADLLRARDQFHPHLVHKRNVVGTAVGRYLIRQSDPWPNEQDDESHDASTPGEEKRKEPRTLENSEVREYSWPCVLVFVDRWVDESQFGKIGEIPASDYVPKTIYLDDGKAVPICVVLAPRDTSPPPRTTPPRMREGRLEGGYPIHTTVQNVEHTGTIGCLFTDGNKVYAMTSRHVAGEPGKELEAANGVAIGATSGLQLGRRPFEEVYAPWPGRNVFVHFDVALVEVSDLRKWSSGIYSVGAVGPLAPLSTYNLSLNLIGCPVRAHGAASGPLRGRIAALFYRFKSIGGFDYVSDFLIGSRTRDPLPTVPGDSGAVWVMDGDEEENEGPKRMPIAVQWGGTVLGAERTTFALAANLSTIARELNVDVYRGPSVATFEYWGGEGHQKIGEYACALVTSPSLLALLTKNSLNIGELANFPDREWKSLRGNENNALNFENPTHYSDMDYRPPGGDSLDDLTPDAASLDPQTWRDYYDGINWRTHRERGLLPFRVWQIYKDLVALIAAGNDVKSIVAAAGILAHYIGDACQPLHSSIHDNGNRFRRKNGQHVNFMFKRSAQFYGKGVHTPYETDMLDDHAGDVHDGIEAQLPAGTNHGMALVDTPRNAAWASIQLMRRARGRIDPLAIVETYAQAIKNGDYAPSELWDDHANETIDTMVDGCRTLAMLWDSAWKEGNGDAIDPNAFKTFQLNALKAICRPGTFLPSRTLDFIDAVL